MTYPSAEEMIAQLHELGDKAVEIVISHHEYNDICMDARGDKFDQYKRATLIVIRHLWKSMICDK